MRHLLSLVLSLVAAPLIYLASGYGFIKWVGAAGPGGSVDGPQVLLGLAGFAVAAGLLGALLMSRLSPVGPAVAGLAFLGIGLWSMYESTSFTDALGFTLLEEEDLGTAGAISAPLIGLVLLGSLFAINRWRAKAPAGAAVAAPTPGEQGYQASLYQPAPYPPVQPPATPSAYAQQFGTYGGQYGSGSPDPVSPPAPAETRVETPATTILTPPDNSWPPPDNNPTLPSNPAPGSGQPGSSWPQPPSAPSWSSPPAGQSWTSAPTSPPPDQEPWASPPTERIPTDRPWGDPPR